MDMETGHIPVLNLGWVELLDMMPHPELGVSADLAVVNAARTSFMGESKGDEADKKLLFYLLKNRHTGPFEMVQFKFRLHAPLLVWWQLVRHRTFSYNLQSGRYTQFSENQFYFPAEWRKQSASNKQGSDGVLDPDEEDGFGEFLYGTEGEFLYQGEGEGINGMLAEYIKLGHKMYRELLNIGVAREQARLFLPGFAVYYTGIVRMDAHNMMHFLKLRLDSHAQSEIREYAEAIFTIFKHQMPWTAEAFEEYVLND